MKILVINTCGPECIVALLDQETDRFFEQKSPSHCQHTEALFDVISNVLLDANCKYESISHIAVVVGPGSFTGIRAGLAALKGLELASNISAHGVSLTELHAYVALCDAKQAVETITISIETQNVLYTQKFDAKLRPISAITMMNGVEQSCSSATIHKLCTLKDCPSSLHIAKYLAYKLDNQLPATPLVPIYSRSYVDKK